MLHLPLYWFDESIPRDQDFTEEALLSPVLSSEGHLSLKEMVVPSKPINIAASVAASPLLLKLWKEAREVLEGNEMVKSGKVKLRTTEVGETGE